jgi:hypothetical protein
MDWVIRATELGVTEIQPSTPDAAWQAVPNAPPRLERWRQVALRLRAMRAQCCRDPCAADMWRGCNRLAQQPPAANSFCCRGRDLAA